MPCLAGEGSLTKAWRKENNKGRENQNASN